MSYSSSCDDTSGVVATGQTVEPYRLLVESAGTVQHASSATVRPNGCSGPNGADEGEQVSIGHFGRRKLTASGAIAKNALVVPDADGKIAADTPTTGEFVVGYALEAATTDGQIIEVIFTTTRPANP